MTNKEKVVDLIKGIVKDLPGISAGRLCSQTVLSIREKQIDIDPEDLVGIIGHMVADCELVEVDFRLPDATQISNKLLFPYGTKVMVS